MAESLERSVQLLGESEPTLQTVTTLESSWLLIILGIFIGCLALEKIRPARRYSTKRKLNSYVTNLTTFFGNNLVLSLFSVTSLYGIAAHLSSGGLLSGTSNAPLKWALSFLLFDLFLYGWHYTNHHVSWLWRFHRIHHSDKSYNVTTALRFHIGGLLLTLFAKAVFILAVGIEAHVLLFCEAVTLLFQLFHHSNITFSGEQLLAKLFIVPARHRVHHSTRRDEHDHNYGAVFSVWDRLFVQGKRRFPPTSAWHESRTRTLASCCGLPPGI